MPELTSLADVLGKPVDDQRVTLRGKIVRQVSGDKYIFSDGRREIRVDIDQKYLPQEPFGSDSMLVIKGEVEKDFLESPEIDVDSVTVVR